MTRLPLVLLTLLLVPRTILAKPTPAQKCAARKVHAAGLKVLLKARCQAKALQKAVPVDAACLTTAEGKFAVLFGKAEAAGGCTVTGDAGTIEAAVDACVTTFGSAIAGDGKCAALKMKAAGKKTNSKAKCQQKSILRGVAVESLCLGKVETKFAATIAKADERGTCTDTATALEALVDACVPSLASGGGPSTGDSLPAGTVAYFDAKTCPSGWDPYAAAAGRTVVPAFDAGAVGTSSGTPLSPPDAPSHTHGFNASLTTTSVSFAGFAGGGNGTPAESATYGFGGVTGPASTTLPYLALLVCKKAPAPVAAGIPDGALLFFDAPQSTCPAGFASYPSAAGRMLVALPESATPGASFGGASGDLDALHSHAMTGSISTTSSGIALASGCCAAGYAGNQVYDWNATSDTSEVGMPWMQLLQCSSQSGAAGDSVPSGLIAFFQGSVCPSHWQEYLPAKGRLLLGTTTAGTVGVTSGTALADGEDRTHTHPFMASVSFNSKNIAAVAGSNLSAADALMYGTSGTTSASTSGLPFTQLLACRRM